MRRDPRALVAVAAVFALLAGGAAVNAARDGNLEVKGASTGPTTTVQVTRSDNWQPGITASINGITELFVQGRPAGLDQYVSRQCPCYAEIERRLTLLEKDGHRYSGPFQRVDEVRLVRSQGDVVRADVKVSYLKADLLDPSGRVVQATEAYESASVETYVKTEGERWLLLNRRGVENTPTTTTAPPTSAVAS